VHYTDVLLAVQQMLDNLQYRVRDTTFWCKGTEKRALLLQYLPEVKNLEEIGCPKYKKLVALTTIPQTTLSKAAVFASWLNAQGYECCGDSPSELPFGPQYDLQQGLDGAI
jgi:hypothetical protein